MPGLVAVTGATGFLGRRLLPVLVADGWRVRVLARSQPEPWAGVRPEVIRGDLNDAAALQKLCAGANAVVHLAGLIKARSCAEFMAANCAGARAVAQATPAGAHMLLVSSLVAREPQLSDYAASKRAGEDAAEDVLGARLSVVRPPAVYGPGDTATLPLFKAAASSPVLPMLGAPDARLALIHADDAVRQIADLAAAPQHGVWALGGARPAGYSWREMLHTLAQAVGRRPVVMQAPPWVAHFGGALSGLAAQAGGRSAVFNAGKAREMLHRDWSVHPHETLRGVTPAGFDLPAGFADTLAWYRAEGWMRNR